MTDQIRKFGLLAPGDLPVRFKDVLGDGTEYAPVFALEPASIGGGGGGVGTDVNVTDRAARLLGHVTVDNASIPVTGTFWQATQPVSGTFWQATQPVSLATNTPDVTDRAARLLGHVTVDNASLAVTGTFWQATQPVSLATNTPDVTDRAARLLGHVTVDNASLAVTGTFWQATQPVSIAAAVDVSDRAARLLGHVTVDNASIAVTGTFWQATQPVSGTVTANQGGAPWSENLTQIAGTALAAKTVPTNADGQVAIPVYVNAQQYATYDVAGRAVVSGVLVAGTAKAIMSFEHSAASTKTVRIRRISVHMIQTTALSGLIDVQITRGTAASSAGSAVTPAPRRSTDPAAEVVVKTLPTITAATVADNIPAGGFATTTTLYSPPVLIYDWQEAGETKPYMLVAGALQSLVINVVSTAAHNLTITVSVDFTEE